MTLASMPSIKTRPITIVQEIPISRTLKFWEGLKEGKVYATQCCKCGKVYFPPSADCPVCICSEMNWNQLSDGAEIEAFTHIVVRPTTFIEQKPYTVAIGRLKEGVKVLAWLTGFKLSQVKVGMKVKLVAKITQDGNPTYEFVPP